MSSPGSDDDKAVFLIQTIQDEDFENASAA